MTLTRPRFAYCVLMLLASTFAGAELAAAQAPAVLPSNSRPATRPMYVQGAVVVLLMAGAIYGVCRSSRRS